MKKYKIFLLLISTISIFSACEKVIEIDLNENNPQYVIEGEITDQMTTHRVKITKTVNFDQPNNYPAVTKAVVTISDDAGNTEILSETQPGIYETKQWAAISGRTYALTVTHEGNSFSAKSKMPDKVLLNGAVFLSNGSGFGTDTLPTFTAIPQYKDPAGVKNFYRFIQYINGVEDKTILVRNDNITDGKTNVQQPLFSFESIYENDQYKLVMQNVDEAIYTYFFSLSASLGQGPGGGTTPSNPPTNIVGGALGYFSAHPVSDITTTVKP
jgi:hypothetical protein